MILNLPLFEREKVYFAHYTHHTHNQITLHAEKGVQPLCLHDLMLNYSEPAESWILKFFDKYVCNTQGSLMFAAVQKSGATPQNNSVWCTFTAVAQHLNIWWLSYGCARRLRYESSASIIYLLIYQFWPDGTLELSWDGCKQIWKLQVFHAKAKVRLLVTKIEIQQNSEICTIKLKMKTNSRKNTLIFCLFWVFKNYKIMLFFNQPHSF